MSQRRLEVERILAGAKAKDVRAAETAGGQGSR